MAWVSEYVYPYLGLYCIELHPLWNVYHNKQQNCFVYPSIATVQ